MLIEKSYEKPCPECGEPMELTADYGLRGEAYSCPICLHVDEVIDLSLEESIYAS